jgi:predicted ATPase
MCLCYSAWGLWERGELALALQRVAHALALASELKHPFSQGEAHGFAASLHLFMGEPAAGLRQADQAIAICEEGGFAVWAAHAHMMRGRCRAALGDVAGGLQEMAQAYANWVATGAVVTRPFYLALQAEGLMLAGDSAAALGLLAQAQATARQNNELYHLAEVLRLTGLAHLQQAGRAQARRAFTQAHALALQQGKRMFALRSALALLHCAKGLAQQVQDRLRLRERLAELPDEPHNTELQAAWQQLEKQP